MLKKLLHARLEDPALLRDFVSHSDAHSPPRSRFSLPYAPELARIREALHPHSLIVLPTPRASVAEVDGRIELLAAGKRMVFKTETAAVIKTLASVHKITLGELLHTAAPTLNEEETRDLVAHLVNLGILAMLDKECDGIVGSGGQ